MKYLSGITRAVENKICPNEYIIWLLSLSGLTVKCTYFQYVTGISQSPSFSTENINMHISLIAVIIISGGAILTVFNTRRIPVLILLHIAVSLLLAADTIYFRYFHSPITVQSIYQIGLASSVTNSILSLLRPWDAVYVADISTLLAALTLGRVDLRCFQNKLKAHTRFLTAAALLASGLASLGFAYSRSSPGTFPFDNNYVVNNLGILYFHYYDAKRFIAQNILDDRSLDADERTVISSFFATRGSSGKKHNGAARGRNLIIVQLEAIQNFLIGLEFNKSEITPNLNRLAAGSIYLDNFYYQTGAGNTSDAEFLVNTSLYPLKDSSVYFRYPNNTYDSLPKLLKQHSYTSYAFHANNPSFWNRSEMYRSIGFDHFVSSVDFEMDECLGWGLSDLSFFRQSLDKIDTSRPFYAFFVTLTSHHPYNYFSNYNRFDAGAFEGTMAGNYSEAAHYVDMAVGEFLKDLKCRGIYDNSLIIIYGDHQSVPRDQTDMLADLINFRFDEFNWTKLQRSPCFIICPGLDLAGTDSTICGQLDLLPTISNLMGFDAPHALGKDILNTDDGYTVLRNGSVITEEFVYTAEHGMTYDSKGQKLSPGRFDSVAEKHRRILEISDLILKKNALDGFEQYKY